MTTAPAASALRPPAGDEDGRRKSPGGAVEASTKDPRDKQDYLLGLGEQPIESTRSIYETIHGRKILQAAECEWLANEKRWTSFWTLTCRDPRPVDVVEHYFRRLIQILNIGAYGKYYPKKVGHSYFSYVRAVEYQKRDVVHFHVLVDEPVDYSYIHRWWRKALGFVWIDWTLDSRSTIDYVTKEIYQVSRYVRKKGEVDHFFRGDRAVPPKVHPSWWPR